MLALVRKATGKTEILRGSIQRGLPMDFCAGDQVGSRGAVHAAQNAPHCAAREAFRTDVLERLAVLANMEDIVSGRLQRARCLGTVAGNGAPRCYSASW